MENVKELIEELAKSLGTTAELLWEVMLKQAPVSVGIYMAEGIVLSSLTLLVYKTAKHFMGKEKQSWDYREVVTALSVVFGVVVGLLWIVYLLHIGTVITALVNPEYWALDQVLEKL